MAKKQETAIVKTEPTALQETNYGEHATALGQMAPGYENQSAADTALPWMKILQPNSPAVAQGLVEGAVIGAWINSVTNQIYTNPQGLVLVPSCTSHEFTEWVPEKHGSGFVARHKIDSEIVRIAKQNSTNFGEYFCDTKDRRGTDGNELQETFYVFGIVCEDEDPVGMACIAFKGSMIKCYKHWMSSIRAHTITENGDKKMPPMYSHLSRFTTKTKTEANKTWAYPVYTAAINGKVADSCLPETDPRFLMAFQLYTMVRSQQANIDYTKQGTEKVSADGTLVGADGKQIF